MITYRNVLLEDETFLFHMFAQSKRDEFALLNWNEAQLNHFLLMQYEIQQRSYAMQYPNSIHQIIMFIGEHAGQIRTVHEEHQIVLIDISLNSKFQSQGIGTAVIQQLQQKALPFLKTIKLHVIQQNRALRLYEKLGFKITDEKPPYFAMEWKS